MSNRISRRNLLIGSAAAGVTIAAGNTHLSSAPAQEGLDLSKPLNGWDTVSGRWATEEVTGAAQGGRALVQRATDNEFNVIVAPGGPYDDFIVSVRFKPISGAEDASSVLCAPSPWVRSRIAATVSLLPSITS